MKIFSGNANPALAANIARYLDMPLGRVDISRFCDGEINLRFEESLRGIDVFIVQSTFPPADNLLEFLLMIDAASRASAKRVTAVIPYFGYARQDRKDQPRVALSAKLVANLIYTAGADRVLTIDLHSPSIQGFFDIPFDHLYAINIFMEQISSIKLSHPVVVAPDVGSSKRAGAYASRLQTDLALVDKKREGPNQIKAVTLIGDVEGRDVVLVDDMIDTAGTLCSAAKLLKERGATSVLAACTHPLLSGDAAQRIQNSVIDKLYITDTVPLPKEKRIDKIEILTAAPILGEAIRRIHNEESVSSLFDSV